MLNFRDHVVGEAAVDQRQLGVFRGLILDESRRPTGTPIPSSTPAQASIVLEAFFRNANDAVRILTGSLNERIYGTDAVLVEAKKFLAVPGRTLTIIFLNSREDASLARNPLVCALRANDNLSLLQAPETISHGFPFHFSVMDENAYRFKKDATSHAAVTAFGDQAFARRLLTMFRYIESMSASKTALLAV